VALKAALFDVGDTLVEHFADSRAISRKARERLRATLGDPPWLDALLDADIEPPQAKVYWPSDAENERQETCAWYADWFRRGGHELDGLDVDRLRALLCVPLAEISEPVPGAFDVLRWCRSKGLRIVLVTNTLARGDEEALADWRGFGLADVIDGIVSSHGTGWRKPHRAMFDRALAIAGARPHEAVHVGDNLVADVWGAKRLGIRAVWRRVADPPQDVAALPDAVIREMAELPAVVERWL